MPKGKRTKSKNVYFSQEEWETVRNRAAALGERVGRFLMDISSNGISRRFDNEDYKALVRPLRSCSYSLAQIEKAARENNSPHLPEIIEQERLLDDISERFDDHFAEMQHEFIRENYWRSKFAKGKKHEGVPDVL